MATVFVNSICADKYKRKLVLCFLEFLASGQETQQGNKSLRPFCNMSKKKKKGELHLKLRTALGCFDLVSFTSDSLVLLIMEEFGV